MTRYSRILEKAKLEHELFGGEPARVEEAEFPAVVASEVELGLPEPVVEPPVEAAVEEGAAPVIAPAEPERKSSGAEVDGDWRLELGQLLGLDSLPDGARLGMCPLGGMKSAAESAVALGLWIAARSSSPTVIVEASFEAPQLARLFRTRRLGLAEAMAAHEPRWDHFVHDTLYPRLKVLPAGRDPGLRNFLKEQDAFCETLSDLGQTFENVIVLLPNPRVRGFDRLAISRAADVIFPVFEPGKLTASHASRAIGKLASGSARVAAALVAPGQVIGETARMEHIAKQLVDAPRGDYA